MEDGLDCWKDRRKCSGCGETRPLAGLSEASLCSCDRAEIARSLKNIRKIKIKPCIWIEDDVRKQTHLRKKSTRKNRKHRD